MVRGAAAASPATSMVDIDRFLRVRNDAWTSSRRTPPTAPATRPCYRGHALYTFRRLLPAPRLHDLTIHARGPISCSRFLYRGAADASPATSMDGHRSLLEGEQWRMDLFTTNTTDRACCPPSAAAARALYTSAGCCRHDIFTTNTPQQGRRLTGATSAITTSCLV